MKKILITITLLFSIISLILISKLQITNNAISTFSEENEDLPSFFLDIGSLNDDSSFNNIYLETGNGISERLTEEEVSYRYLNQTNYLYFYINTSSMDWFAENGVPYKDAIMEIGFKDEVNETGCSVFKDRTTNCRARLEVKLDYGDYLNYQKLNGIGGLGNSNWNKTIIFFENNPWQLLRSIDEKIYFRIYVPPQLNYTNLPLDYINFSFVSKETFNELREQDRLNRSFNRSDYEEANIINSSNYENPYVIYTRNYLEKTYPNTIPNESEILQEGSKLETFEISGNYEPLTFSIYAFEDLDNVQINISDLINGNNKITSDNIKIEKVVYIDKRWTSAWSKTYGTNPWYLEDFNSANIEENKTQQFWLTIYVPPQTPRGIYSGNIKIAGDNIEEEIPLELEVYNVDLEEPDTTPYLYHSPYLYYKSFAKDRETAVRNIAEHDLYPIVYLRPTINTQDYSINYSYATHGDYGGYSPKHEFDILEDYNLHPEKIMVTIQDNHRTIWEDLCENTEYYAELCPEFDEVYRGVLESYADFARGYGSELKISYNDEPGIVVDRRMQANYLNRLTREVGIETWVTYYSTCEIPLAGHYFSFLNEYNRTEVTNNHPEWLDSNNSLVSYWDFETDTKDQSQYNNSGYLEGDAKIENGVLVLDGDEDYFYAEDNETLEGMEELSVSLWFKLNQTDKFFILGKGGVWGSYSIYGYNDHIYFFLRNSTNNYPVAATSPLVPVSPNKWQHYVGISNRTGVFQYLNGVYMWSDNRVVDEISKNYGRFYIARGISTDFPDYINGSIDELMIFNRSLSTEEVKEIYYASGGETLYKEGLYFNLSTNFENSADLSSAINIYFDEETDDEHFHATKKVYVNENLAWQSERQDYSRETFEIDLEEFILSGINNLTLSLEYETINSKNLQIYFLDEFWRNKNWLISKGDYLNYTYIPDPSGSLGPMDPYLENRVHALRYTTKENIEKTYDSNDLFSFYSTYAATEPVITYNRFLNGIYASSINADSVNIYAYGDWGSQPYDDLDSEYGYRIGDPMSQRGQARYELVLPSWEDKLYNTLPYESLREGIEDSKIIATLKNKINENPGAKSTEARNYLESLYLNIDKDLYLNYWASYDTSESILGDLSGDETNYYAFDDMRKKMINYIIELEGDSESIKKTGSTSSGTSTTLSKTEIITTKEENETIKNESLKENEKETPFDEKSEKSKTKIILIIFFIAFSLSILILLGIQKKIMENNLKEKEMKERKIQEKIDNYIKNEIENLEA